MTREQLEKAFDEKFQNLYSSNVFPSWGGESIQLIDEKQNVRSYIFDAIIPEVLRSVVPEKWHMSFDSIKGSEYSINSLKMKAKELYNIDL